MTFVRITLNDNNDVVRCGDMSVRCTDVRIVRSESLAVSIINVVLSAPLIWDDERKNVRSNQNALLAVFDYYVLFYVDIKLVLIILLFAWSLGTSSVYSHVRHTTLYVWE